MNLKRLGLLTTVAIALVAFVIPASASASGTWTHKGKKLAKDATVDLTGWMGVGTGLGTFSCVVHKEATLTATYDGKIVKTGTGHLNEVQTTTSECEATGALAGCELVEDEFTAAPKMLTAREKDFIITDGIEMHYSFESCPLSEVTLTFEELTYTPDDPLEMNFVEVSGEGVMDTLGQEIEAFAFGELEFVGEAAGTYGVHEPK